MNEAYLEHTTLSGALTANNADLRQVDLRCRRAHSGEDILKLVDDSNNLRS